MDSPGLMHEELNLNSYGRLGLCYLKISSYLPFQCEFYFNGHNAIVLQLDQKKIHHKLCGNAFVDIDDPDAIAEAVKSLNGRMVMGRITYCLPAVPT
ncbi:MAG: RNA-binding protein [Desulfatirhabdiaceae bacterium]